MKDDSRQAVVEAVEKTVEVAGETARRPLVKKLARLGFYTKGVLFIIIGLLAILVAVGIEGGAIADPVEAIAAVGQKPFGSFLLIVFIAGAFGHGVWNILRGVADVDNAGTKWQGIVQRIVPVGIGLFYFGLAWAGWELLIYSKPSAGSDEVQKTLVAVLLALPLGAVLVFLIGIGIIASGLHECYSGITGKYQENYRVWEITGFHMKLITVFGVLSFVARALILALIGYFFILAAVGNDPNAAGGIEAALVTLAQSYYGKTFLFVTAVGLACHGVLALYEARYRRIC